MKLSTPLFTLMAAGLLTMTACNEHQQDQANEMAENAEANIDTAVDRMQESADNLGDKIEAIFRAKNPDSSFLVKATLDNNMELRLLQAGAENGTDKELTSHAKMMMTDHKKLGGKVMAFASRKGYSMPVGDDGKADNEMASLSGKTKGMEWDKEWVDEMVSAHKDAIDLFERGENRVNDAELKAMITETLPTLRSHLNMVKGLQDRMSK